MNGLSVNEKLGLSVTEAAELIGVSRPFFYELMRRDDFDAVVHLGRRKVISRSKLEEWLRRQAEEGRA